MIETEQLISETENLWLNKLYLFIEDNFRNSFIPSHDHTHHLRVWNNAKALITSGNFASEDFSRDIIESILFATMFHDSGLTITLSEEHGAESAKIFNSFCQSISYHPSFFEKIFEAITIHDDKTYKNCDSQNIISTILNIADDLDSFGTIGIFRYAEIYTQRSIDIDKIPYRIIDNITLRWNNFSKTIKPSPLKDEVYNQFSAVINFFSSENKREINYLLDALKLSEGKYKTIADFIELNKTSKSHFIGLLKLKNR